MDLTTSLLIGALLPLFTGCATGHAASECPEVRQPVAASPQPSAVPSASASVALPAQSSSPSAPTLRAQPAASASSTEPATLPTPASTGSAPLPELKVRLSGMHIGGGPNDEASKRPFIHVIEAGYDNLRTCYRKAEDPMQGGTFGVDLKVGAKGGTPEIQQVRTALKGEPLRECLATVFKGMQFASPPKGPTVVSVSIRFTLGL